MKRHRGVDQDWCAGRSCIPGSQYHTLGQQPVWAQCIDETWHNRAQLGGGGGAFSCLTVNPAVTMEDLQQSIPKPKTECCPAIKRTLQATHMNSLNTACTHPVLAKMRPNPSREGSWAHNSTRNCARKFLSLSKEASSPHLKNKTRKGEWGWGEKRAKGEKEGGRGRLREG